MWYQLVFGFCFYIISTNALRDQLCTTPEGTAGICIRKEICPSIIKLEQKTNQTEEDKEFINNSTCTYDDNTNGYFCCELKRKNMTADNASGIVNPKHREPVISFTCITANGTKGTCIQSRNCPYIHRLNGASLSLKEVEFLKKSVCGIDLDNSKLFCCDNSASTRVDDQVEHIKSPQNSVQRKTADEANILGVFATTPFTPTTTTVATTEKPANQTMFCQTPNGEKAHCVKIYNCNIIISNLSANTSEEQKRFIKESGCGFDKEKTPLVCCGTASNYLENIDRKTRTNFKQNPLIPSSQCGMQNFTIPNRIFGGRNTEIGEFPWVALLEFEDDSGKKMFACGGSLISSRYVLTAAHCVYQSAAFKLTGVRLGEWDYNNKGKDCITIEGSIHCNEAEVTVGVETILPHPEYQVSSTNKYHDIALIRLNQEVSFTKYISPICLPSTNDYVPPGERLTISGWGLIGYNEQTTIQQKVEVPVISRSQCSLMFERSRRLTKIGTGQFCAGGEPGKDACIGDSGTPLMRKFSSISNLGPWYVEGIVSFGTGCGLENQYGVYTKVSEYLSWIHTTVEP